MKSGFLKYGPLFSGLRNSRKGSSMILTALLMTVILGFSSVCVDVGITVNAKSRLSNSVDAAALAGAQELVNSVGNAETVARDYLSANGIDSATAEIELFDSNTKIRVTANKTCEFTFAKFLGINSTNVESTGVAECAPIVGVSQGIRPFAIEQQQFDFNVQYTLKEGGGSGTTGNYGALALGGNGAAEYKVNIVDGYDSYLEVGDFVPTEPGNMSGPTLQGITTLMAQCTHTPACTYDNVNPNCPRLITVVIVDSLSVSGRCNVTITGFAKFFLEGVSGSGRESVVTGRFIRTSGSGAVDSSQTDYGFRGVRLIE